MQQKNVQMVLNLAQSLHKQAQARASTSRLNDVLRRAIESRPPSMRHHKSPRLYYATQTESCPPTIVCFTNGHDVFSEPYQRYLVKALHDELPYAEVPIRLMWRVKGEQDLPDVVMEKSGPPRRIHGRPEKKAPNKQRSLRALQAEQEAKKRAVKRSSRPAKWKQEEKRGDVWRNV
jgi:hypothetical protein